ncbi:MAG: hypothetical protein AB8G18_10190 [Gammaproteobacteria bacterium]
MFDITEIHDNDFVTVRLITNETVYGVVLNHSGDYVVLKEYLDFTYLGYKFISSKFISDIKRYKPVDMLAKIVSAEKMTEVDSEYRFLSEIGSSDQLLKELQSTHRVCIFHEDGEHLTLGRLFKIAGKYLFIQRILTDFVYEKTYFRLHKHSISMIELGSEYLRVYRDYSDEPVDHSGDEKGNTYE